MTIEELITKKEKELRDRFQNPANTGYRVGEEFMGAISLFLESSLREAYEAANTEFQKSLDVLYEKNKVSEQWYYERGFLDGRADGLRSVKLEKKETVVPEAGDFVGMVNYHGTCGYNQAIHVLEALKESLLGKEQV